jgi:hypothetical protein
MNLLTIGQLPALKQAHNCQTWFPNGNPFEKIEWCNGGWVVKEVGPSPARRVYCPVSKYAEIARDVAQHFAGQEFKTRDVVQLLCVDMSIANQIVQYLVRYEMIEKVGFVREGKSGMSIYRANK